MCVRSDNSTLCCINYAWTLDRWFGYSYPFAPASCGDLDQGFVEPAHYHSLHLQQRAHTSVLAWLCRRVEVIYQMVISCLDSVSPAGQQDLSMDSQGDEGSSASFESPTSQVRWEMEFWTSIDLGRSRRVYSTHWYSSERCSAHPEAEGECPGGGDKHLWSGSQFRGHCIAY